MGEYDPISASAPVHALDAQSRLRVKPADEERRQPHHQDDEKPNSQEPHGDVLELHTSEKEIVVESVEEQTPANRLDIAA